MTEEEMLKRIKELEIENEKLKNRRIDSNSIKISIKNQDALAFIIPTYSIDKKWKMSTAYPDFTHLRKLAMSTVNKVDDDNKFKEQKVKELSDEDFMLVVNCADELVQVIAKYKKQYLQSVGREDIIEAFNM